VSALPPADTIPRGLLERCPRPRHTRTGTTVLVLPRAPAQAYPTAYSPSNDDHRIQTSPPRPHTGGVSASASTAHFPPPIMTTRRGRRGGGRASASKRMTPRALTCSPAFGSGYYSSRRPRGRGRRGDGGPAPPCAPARAPAAAGPASTAHSTAYSPSTTTAHSEPKRMARASRAMDDDGRGNGGSAERWTRGTRSGYRVSRHNDGGGSVGGQEIQGGLVLLPEVKHGHG
jgi:hypothetical protein